MEGNYFKVIKASLFVLGGVNFDEVQNKRLSLLLDAFCCFMIVTAMYLCFVSTFVDLLLHLDDFDYISFGVCYAGAQFAGLVKGTVLVAKRKSIRNYLQLLESDHFAPNIQRGGRVEHQLIRKAIKLCNLQAMTFWALVSAIVFIRTCDFLFNPKLDVEVTGNTTRVVRLLPYNMYFPFDKYNYYKTAWLYEIYSMFIFGLFLVSCDSLITGIMIHLRVQLQILNNSLLTVEDRAYRMCKGAPRRKNSLEKLPPEVQRCATKIMRGIIQHHQKIVYLTEKTEAQFTLAFFVQFFSIVVLLCLQLWQLSIYEPGSPNFASMASFLTMTLLQLLLYCWNGNELTSESLKVADAVYLMDWTMFDVETQKSAMLMMERAQRPLRLTAGKFAFLSLETFSAVVRGSASYYLAIKKFKEG